MPGTINRVIALYTEGQTETEISEALDLREEDITHTIEDYIDKGSN